jgi:hypothetical protein
MSALLASDPGSVNIARPDMTVSPLLTTGKHFLLTARSARSSAVRAALAGSASQRGSVPRRAAGWAGFPAGSVTWSSSLRRRRDRRPNHPHVLAAHAAAALGPVRRAAGTIAAQPFRCARDGILRAVAKLRQQPAADAVLAPPSNRPDPIAFLVGHDPDAQPSGRVGYRGRRPCRVGRRRRRPRQLLLLLKTFGTEPAPVGVALGKAMHLRRHTNPKLMARICVDVNAVEPGDAVNELQRLGIRIFTTDDLPEERA